MDRRNTQGTLTLETLGDSARRLLAMLEQRANGKAAPRGPRLRLVAANENGTGSGARGGTTLTLPATVAGECRDGLEFDELIYAADADDDWIDDGAH